MTAPLVVLFADNHVLAVAKPAGVPTVPDESGDESLLERAKEWVRRDKQKPGAVFLAVCHRLDRPVSGIVVFARTSKAAARFGTAFRERQVAKTYYGLGCGRARLERGVLEQWLEKDRDTNVVRVVAPGRGKRALTRFRALGFDDGLTWLEFEPLTGRSHQLRLAACELGTPLAGDLKYGAPIPLTDRSIALHAAALEIGHPIGGQKLRLTCEPPPLAIWNRVRNAARDEGPPR